MRGFNGLDAAVCLIGYGIVVAVLAPRVLAHRKHLDRAPTLGVTIWLAAFMGALVAWVVAVLLIAAEVLLSPDVRHVVDRCLASFCAAALGAHGTVGQWLAVGSAVVLTAGTVGTAFGLSRALLRFRARMHRHADAARLLGRHDDALGAVILDVPERVVYAIAGRPSTIVLSRPALHALDENQLAVVLAHERAHLTGRHHLLRGLSSALARVMPRIPLFTAGHRELARLVEMCADDAAVRDRDRDARHLVSALLALTAPVSIPGAALAAAATGVIRRAERLMSRPSRGTLQWTRVLLTTGSIGLLAGPVVVGSVLCGVLPF
ncbi:M56 family metallopeptidase [Pseudonocardia abyssalis]|uniref:M56 family metallopeptidase n=1 Tax=Pseudonocardia abyssalis TaxID=2792008 RepID=A0ABS6ULX4_9PSEU|nr:M56 family metallopeptidase [Pseudonocardia abyssalis]MBW0114129.1 M56 family metallopeptidase [Pseudonocardia abyssalis]MBW0133231.1 M56 family metallopeptidase [Pseudonocardia abyssalis]